MKGTVSVSSKLDQKYMVLAAVQDWPVPFFFPQGYLRPDPKKRMNKTGGPKGLGFA